MKVNRGKLNNWQTHTIDYPEDVVVGMYPQLKGKDFVIVTGSITDDPSGKRINNDHCRTSFVLTIDRENGILETLNSVYELGIEGGDVLGVDLGNGVLSLFY